MTKHPVSLQNPSSTGSLTTIIFVSTSIFPVSSSSFSTCMMYHLVVCACFFKLCSNCINHFILMCCLMPGDIELYCIVLCVASLH